MNAIVIQLPKPRTLTARERMEALMLAQMHEERAEACMANQAALRELLNMTAKFLRSLAHDARR